MTNFSFLQTKNEYVMFASAAMEAEKVYGAAPAMCAIGCRKALELAVKWVYAADNDHADAYKDNLQSLLHEPSFRFAVDHITWGKLPFIVKLGTWRYIRSGRCSLGMLCCPCGASLRLSSGWITAMVKIMKIAISTRRRFQQSVSL